MKLYFRFLVIVFGILVGTAVQAGVIKILVTEEIDNDHIITVTGKGDQLLLEIKL